jgi:hypothetical protein
MSKKADAFKGYSTVGVTFLIPVLTWVSDMHQDHILSHKTNLIILKQLKSCRIRILELK